MSVWRAAVDAGRIRVNPSQAAEALKGLKADPPVLPTPAPRLEEPVRSQVYYLALSMLDLLEGEIIELGDDLLLEDPGWRAKVVQACRAREDLECASRVVQDSRLDDALTACDKHASDFIDSIPTWKVEDELVEEAGCNCPDAWWGRPAFWEV